MSPFPPSVLKTPTFARPLVFVADTNVTHEIVKHGRAPVLGKIGGGATNENVDGGKLTRNQARVRQLANAKRPIKAALDEIDRSVVAHEVDLEPWMATNQLRHERSDVPLAEGDRGSEANEACGLSGAGGQGALRLIKGAQDSRCLIVEDASRFGKSNAACRAAEQPGAKPPLQSIHVLGHHGGRQPKRSGGS